MNPDKEDPNNHVPVVSPDDEWVDLDVAQVFDSQLPPLRSDASRIPKMDVNLSAFKTIYLDRHAGEAASIPEDANQKSLASLHVHVECSPVEEESVQVAPVLENLKQVDVSAKRQERPLRQRRRVSSGERDDWGSNPKGSTSWMLYTALGVIGVIALIMFSSHFAARKSDLKLKNYELGQVGRVKDKKEPIKDSGVLMGLMNSYPEAIQIYGRYAQAKNENDFLKYIYLSERNAPLLKDSWKPIGAKSGWMPSDQSSWELLRDGELFYGELRGVNHNFSNFLAFFRYENSDLKLDWKATTGYGTASFNELKIGEGDGSEIRGWIAPSDFFTQQLPDDKYHSYIFRSTSKDDSVWVYAEIGSQVDQNILALFSNSLITGESQTEVGVILNLERGNLEILPLQWMIKNLKAANWLDIATP
jgi:hypothetical protein